MSSSIIIAYLTDFILDFFSNLKKVVQPDALQWGTQKRTSCQKKSTKSIVELSNDGYCFCVNICRYLTLGWTFPILETTSDPFQHNDPLQSYYFVLKSIGSSSNAVRLSRQKTSIKFIV